MKYDNMVAENKRNSCEYEDRAIAEIRRMLGDEEQVTVSKLMKKLGMSRSFFYNNKRVHNELQRAQELQEGKSFVTAQKVILDKAMEKENELLKAELKKKDAIIESLAMEIEKLKKADRNKLRKLIHDM